MPSPSPHLSSSTEYVVPIGTSLTMSGPFPGIALGTSSTTLQTIPNATGTVNDVLTLTAGGPAWVTPTPSAFNVVGDAGSVETISAGDTLTVASIPNTLIRTASGVTDTVSVGIDTTSAVVGQVVTFDGSNVVWANNTSEQTTVSDTNSVDLTLTGNDITADIKISATAPNIATVAGDGLLVQETVTSLSQNVVSGVMTYSKEDGTTDTAVVHSTDAGNVLSVGTDGGLFYNGAGIVTGAVWDDVNNEIDLTFADGSTISIAIVDALASWIYKFDITDGTTTDEITNGNTLTIAQGNGATVAITAADTFTVSSRLSTDAGNDVSFGTDGGLMLDTSTVAWDLLGNAGTADTVNFIGTTDAQDHVVKVNNIEVMRHRHDADGLGNPALEVLGGTANGAGSVAIGNGAEANSLGMFVYGASAGNGATNASNSNFIGGNAGNVATDAKFSNFIGYFAGDNATNANNSNFLGPNAGRDATNSYGANFIGASAGNGATDSNYSNFIGFRAGNGATNSVSSNFIGASAGQNATNATDSQFIGQNAGNTAATANNSIFIGRNSGLNDTVDNSAGGTSILIGDDTNTGGFSDSIAIGKGAVNTASNEFMIGSAAGTLYDIVNPAYPNSRDDSGTFAPTNFLYTDGSGKVLSAPKSSVLAGSIRTVTANDAFGTTDITIHADTTGGAVSITLPDPAASIADFNYNVKIVSGSSNVTVNPFAAETIDGSTSYSIATPLQMTSVSFYTDGTNWFVR